MDIRLKNKLIHGFRFELIKYSLFSLIYAIGTVSGFYFLLYGIYHLLENISSKQQLSQENMHYGVLNSIQNIPYNQTYDVTRSLTGEFGRKIIPMETPQLVFLILFTIILVIMLFIVYFLILIKPIVNYLEEIALGVNNISSGNFDTRISIRKEDEFSLIASRINKMADDVKKIMENERRDEYMKNDLITSVAHDLRTPLTSIIGYLDLVSNKQDLDEDMIRRYVSIAYNKSIHLQKLIEDLFAYTKFKSGEVMIYPSEIDLVKFLEQLIDEFFPSFQEAGLEYTFMTSQEQVVFLGDGDLLMRAFANLISNAIKYGKDGKSIKIYLSKTIDSIVIELVNYGELIPEGDLENIFERFYRVESSRSSETGGTGLGLAIAKNIIKMHGGDISVRSDFNGTVFRVSLPNQIPKENFEKGE